MSRHHIAYVTGLDGWGDGEPRQEDRESFCALVEERLALAYPEHTVEAYVDERATGDSRVTTDDPAIQKGDVLSLVQDVWDDWCGGARGSAAMRTMQLAPSHVQAVCKPGSGEETCAFLAARQLPQYFCAKGDPDLVRAIRQRLDEGSMGATGNNCSGPPDYKPARERP